MQKLDGVINAFPQQKLAGLTTPAQFAAAARDVAPEEALRQPIPAS